MAYYFCLRDALSRLENNPQDAGLDAGFLEVYTEPPEGKVNKVDVLVIERSDILNLTREEGAFDLTALLAQNHLYRLNTEILLDRALTNAPKNVAIKIALETAFSAQKYPSPIEENIQERNDGNLNFPTLAHISDTEIAQIYCTFIKQLDKETAQQFTLKNILRQHATTFLQNFEGYRDSAGVFISLKHVFSSAHRADHDPSRRIEDYIENGRERATSMGIKTFEDIAKAYLSAEEYQLRRAQDIDAVAQKNWEQIPSWLRQDVFALLEREAMKQVFALHLIEAHDFAALFKTRSKLKKSIEIHAGGHVDTELQQLLTETLNNDARYSGSAGRFAAKVEERLQETF